MSNAISLFPLFVIGSSHKPPVRLQFPRHSEGSCDDAALQILPAQIVLLSNEAVIGSGIRRHSMLFYSCQSSYALLYRLPQSVPPVSCETDKPMLHCQHLAVLFLLSIAPVLLYSICIVLLILISQAEHYPISHFSSVCLSAQTPLPRTAML